MSKYDHDLDLEVNLKDGVWVIKRSYTKVGVYQIWKLYFKD